MSSKEEKKKRSQGAGMHEVQSGSKLFANGWHHDSVLWVCYVPNPKSCSKEKKDTMIGYVGVEISPL